MNDLPSVHEPLVLADGRVVNPKNGSVSKPKLVEVPRNAELKQQYAAVQRKLSDLPLPTKDMHGLGAILSYKLFGLTNEDICVATGLPATQLENILQSEAYVALHDGVIDTIKNRDSDGIRDLIHKNAVKAVEKVHDILEDGSEAAQVALIKDMLDRDGFRPADVVEHRHKMDGGLKVEIIRKGGNISTAVDVEFKEIGDEHGS